MVLFSLHTLKKSVDKSTLLSFQKKKNQKQGFKSAKISKWRELWFKSRKSKFEATKI